MATTLEPMKAEPPSGETVRTPKAERRLRPVNAWALLGVLFVAWDLYLLVAWAVSGDMEPTPVGPDQPPIWMKVIVRSWEIGSIVGVAIFLWFFMIRPWRRKGHITTDGIMIFGFLTMFWQDMFLNFFQVHSTYNSYMWNAGAWYKHIPGWMSQHGNLMPEPLVWAIPAYIYLEFGVAVFLTVIMRRAKARWPQMGKMGIILCAFAVCAVLDVIFEPIFEWMGLYTYAGAIEALSIFDDHYYKFPLYEAIFFPACLTGFAALRFFTNDKGQTWAERGIEHVRSTSNLTRTWRRFFAIAGVLNIIYLGCYYIPQATIGLFAGPWPEDMKHRSYLGGYVCGPNSANYEGYTATYHCPGPDIPIPRPNSPHLDSDGKLVRSDW